LEEGQVLVPGQKSPAFEFATSGLLGLGPGLMELFKESDVIFLTEIIDEVDLRERLPGRFGGFCGES
jgi:hypothetical protein